MTSITQEQTSETPQAPQHFTLALYAHLYGLDMGGGHIRTALLAQIIVEQAGMDPVEAIELARTDAFDPRVREAGRLRDRLMADAETLAWAAEQDGSAA